MLTRLAPCIFFIAVGCDDSRHDVTHTSEGAFTTSASRDSTQWNNTLVADCDGHATKCIADDLVVCGHTFVGDKTYGRAACPDVETRPMPSSFKPVKKR